MDNQLSNNIPLQDVISVEDHRCTFPMDNTNTNSQNNDIVLPDSTDLDWAQITFALNYNRLLFINNCKAWSDFQNENGYNYIDYTSNELCHRFLSRVLPNIYEYELTENELHLLKLLDLHPLFIRTDIGFDTVGQVGNLTFPSNEAAIETLMKNKCLNETNFVEANVNLNDQIVVIGHRDQSSFRQKFSFNAENAALLSVALSSDEDLPNCELLTATEVQNRLKAAKSRFEKNGQQLENVNISIDDLLKKLSTLSKLKVAVTELIDKSFRRQIVENVSVY